MRASATFTKILFSFLLINLILVVTVAALRPVLARQEPGDPVVAPEVQIPETDPPSLPAPSLEGVPSAAVAMPKVATPPPTVPPNPMVMDEILKAIQENRSDLDVPPLSYPPLPLNGAGKANDGKSSATESAAASSSDLQQLAQRMKSIAQLTQSAQALITEAQHLKSIGQPAAAHALAEHVQTLRSIIVQLAAEGTEPATITPVY